MEETSTNPDYSAFREKLINAKSNDKKGKEGIGGRYAVFDVEYEAEGGGGQRNKITFISWVPDDAPQYVSLLDGTRRRMRGWYADTYRYLATHDVLDLQGRPQACSQRTRRRHSSQRCR